MKAKRTLGAQLFSLTLASTGCAVPGPYVHGAQYEPATEYKSGHDFCGDLEHGARAVSKGELAVGVLLGLAAAGALATSTVLASGNAISSSERGAIIGMPIAGAGLGVASGLLLSRSRHASELASAASEASSADEDLAGVKASRACTAALAAWNSGRSSAAASAQSQLQDLEKEQADKNAKVVKGLERIGSEDVVRELQERGEEELDGPAPDAEPPRGFEDAADVGDGVTLRMRIEGSDPQSSFTARATRPLEPSD